MCPLQRHVAKKLSRQLLERCLVSLQRLSDLSSRRKSRRQVFLPSLLFSKVRSVVNKLDEVSLRLSNYQPDDAVLTEFWLDDNILDSALSIDNHALFSSRSYLLEGRRHFMLHSFNHFLFCRRLQSSSHRCLSFVLTEFIAYLTGIVSSLT